MPLVRLLDGTRLDTSEVVLTKDGIDGAVTLTFRDGSRQTVCAEEAHVIERAIRDGVAGPDAKPGPIP